MNVSSHTCSIISSRFINKVRRVASYHLLSLVPCDEDTDPAQRPSSRTLVELVPLPSSVAFWYVSLSVCKHDGNI